MERKKKKKVDDEGKREMGRVMETYRGEDFLEAVFLTVFLVTGLAAAELELDMMTDDGKERNEGRCARTKNRAQVSSSSLIGLNSVYPPKT